MILVVDSGTGAISVGSQSRLADFSDGFLHHVNALEHQVTEVSSGLLVVALFANSLDAPGTELRSRVLHHPDEHRNSVNELAERSAVASGLLEVPLEAVQEHPGSEN